MSVLYKGTEGIPADAIVLFDGKDMSNWTKRKDGTPAAWKVENGYMEVVPGHGDILSKELFNDCQVHVEFWLPLMADCKGQARSNSGVYLQSRYEVQVLDSYELDSGFDDCGAIYTQWKPMVNAGRPPEVWQTYDILFKAPRFNELGVKIANARLSVLFNGIWIHNDIEIPQFTGGQFDENIKEPGPLMLQDHNNFVRFRNVWARKLEL
ncbi:MAG: DUF1080 domain-containing protein [bacterium]|jgi:hypothetical protein